MKPTLSSCILSLSLLLGASTAQADAAADIARLAWLGGCWKLEGSEAGTMEQWLPLAGGTLIGVGRTVKKGKTVAHEFLQIREQADGRLAFMAQPSGQPAAVFPLASLSDTEAVFENPQHDFPQRVIYARDGDDRLKARIEGLRTGQLRVMAFPMRRVSCNSPG